MTLKEMLTGALQQLDRNTDSQTLELWRDKLTQYLNDAVIDLSGVLQPRRTDALALADHEVDLAQLPRTCVKVIALKRGAARLPFYYGVGTGLLHVPAVADGQVVVTYRYLPPILSADTDVPELPNWCHGALISYAVGRERASGDNMSINAAKACFEIYFEAKRNMRAVCGECDAYRIENKYGGGADGLWR